MLGDMERTAGTVRITGSIAYVAQSAWITNDTVQGNITFGKPFDQGRYNRVVEATCLEHDFKVTLLGHSNLAGLMLSESLPLHYHLWLGGSNA